MRRFWNGFFWGPPSHKRIAWVGAVAGALVVVLPLVIAVFGQGANPLFLLALFVTGLAEAGWGIELLPRRLVRLAGGARAARWLCSVVGLVLSAVSLVFQLGPLWFVAPVGVGALLLVFEMAPYGPANRP